MSVMPENSNTSRSGARSKLGSDVLADVSVDTARHQKNSSPPRMTSNPTSSTPPPSGSPTFSAFGGATPRRFKDRLKEGISGSFSWQSRRASQDVGIMSRSADSIAPTTKRSKSRSVDHGLTSPFDLDSLRSTVEGRFESIDRMSKDGDKKKSSMPIIPTVSYTVGNRDTLTSVAARFDTTPSELTHLNRLNSSFIYPGQQLLVPDKGATNDEASTGESANDDKIQNASGKSSPIDKSSLSESNPEEDKDRIEGLQPDAPKPGHIKRVENSSKSFTDLADDPIITQRFLKINVRHITDGQGVVGGVLLVTPNAVMFDPNVSDPLVIEHGPESYGVIAPMELVVNAAIFYDIAHMRVSGGDSSSTEKVEIYYMKTKKDDKDTNGKAIEGTTVKNEQETITETETDSIKEATEKSDVFEVSSITAEGDGKHQIDKTHNQTTKSCAVEKESTKSESSESKENENKSDEAKSFLDSGLEMRRKSLLDQHWAIPKKTRSLEEEVEKDKSTSSQDNTDYSFRGDMSLDNEKETTTSDSIKDSCYDSGIDLHDTKALPIVKPLATKKVYSDADIVLSSEWVPPKTIAPTHVNDSPSKSQLAQSGISLLQTQSLDTSGGRKKTSSVSFSVDDNEQQNQTSQSTDKSTEQNKKNKMLKRLSYPLTWVEGLTGENSKSTDSSESAPNTGDSNQSVFSKVFSSSPITLVSELGGNLFLSKTPSEESGGSPVPPVTPQSESHSTPGRSSIGTFMRPNSTDGTTGTNSSKQAKNAPPKLDYRSMVSIDDMPELFVSFDMRAPLFPQLKNLELIPRPARACQDPPLYLRLRMGRPEGKAIPLPTSVMSYGKNKLRPEYWFSIPKNRVDELYRFVHTWVPHLYGELNEEQIAKRGFELIQHDTEWFKDGQTKDGRRSSDGEDIAEMSRESWELLKAPYVKIYNIIKTAGSHELDFLGGEVLSMSTDEYRKASLFATGSFDLEFPIPDLIGQTEILTEEHREKLCAHLPARAEGYSWTLVFSTSQNGFSLNSLYRKMQRLESPILIVIEDTEHNVFGALTSCSLRVSDHFYGTGESLLFKFNPSFKVFHWTGENLYFIKGNAESLSIGAGDGKFGLWLDGDLNQGRSQQCSTYANEALAPQEDFVIKTLECWAFV